MLQLDFVARAGNTTIGVVGVTTTDFDDAIRALTLFDDVPLWTIENRPFIHLNCNGIGRHVRVLMPEHGQLIMCAIKVSGRLATGERSGPPTAVPPRTNYLYRYRSSVTWSDKHNISVYNK